MRQKFRCGTVQGPGCYGHNGADDAAADAAVIAMRMPGRPIRVRWRRAEEFAYEPVSPAIVVKVRALLDAAGSPSRLDDGNLEQQPQRPARERRAAARGKCFARIHRRCRRPPTCRRPMAAMRRYVSSVSPLNSTP